MLKQNLHKGQFLVQGHTAVMGQNWNGDACSSDSEICAVTVSPCSKPDGYTQTPFSTPMDDSAHVRGLCR